MNRRIVLAAVAALMAGSTVAGAAAATTPPTTEPATDASTTDMAGTSSETTQSVESGSAATLGELRLIGEVDVPNLAMVGGTLVGGLSGIDYDPVRDAWVIISDDRSDNNPARLYDATLAYDEAAFTNVSLLAQHPLRQETGATYPSGDQGGAVPDPEAIRVDPNDGSLWWTSEGNQELGLDPVLVHANPRGLALATYPVPDTFGANPEEEAFGARNNKAFEGLTFSADGQSLFAIMEGALYQDAELPTLDAGSVTRIVQFDLDGNVIAQYAYPLDPLPAAGEGELADLADNGATEILAVTHTTFLVIERAGIPQDGPWDMYVRLYEVDISGATDINGIDALAGADYTPVSKSLVLNFRDAGLEHVDNLEGITFGPDLANGNQSLVIISDNNFDPTSVTQFLAYEVSG